MALKDKPIQADAVVDARLAAAITARLQDGKLTCAAAWDAAEQLGVPAHAVGRTADSMRIHLCACQLGFFGPARHGEGAGAAASAPEAFAHALLAARRERNEVACARVLAEADRCGVSRLAAGGFADQLGIKVRDCDLGAF